jgi:hypothetical protein
MDHVVLVSLAVGIVVSGACRYWEVWPNIANLFPSKAQGQTNGSADYHDDPRGKSRQRYSSGTSSQAGDRRNAFGGYANYRPTTTNSSHNRRSHVADNCPRSNPSNNHDKEKHRHATREDAQAEIHRMRRNGYEGSERLTEYYSDELQAYFIGRNKFY